MPSGKYYCDYCDKEFQDTAVARRRHLQSSSHLRAKSLWFNNINNNNNNIINNNNNNQPPFAAAAAAFPGKSLCNRFLNTGFCPYGDSCKYAHPPPPPPLPVPQVVGSPIISGDHLVAGRSPLQGDVVRDSMGMSWGNLPPSLRPPPEGGYLPLPFVDWG